MTVIQRAKFMDKFMTGFFYVVAGFFLLLLLAFTLYVIIKGLQTLLRICFPLLEMV